jgi:flagellar basal-body rod modification protein FlgD
MDNPLSVLPSGLDAARLNERAATGARDKVGQDQFLELMITQLKNQDPMKPMDNGQFLSQMAQFGTVSGINELQQSFGSLATALQSSQALQASTMVGRKVLIEHDQLLVNGTDPTKFALDLPLAASAVRVSIQDPAGQQVRRLEFGATPAGLADVAWDGLDTRGGPAAAGAYTLKAEALIDGKIQTLTTLVRAPVESVTLPRTGEAPVLNLSTYGAFKIDAIKRVL